MSNEIALMREIARLQNQIDALRTIEVGGVWTAYTPTITAGAGAFTTVAATGFYSKLGNIAPIIISIAITTNGTASGSVIATLPFTVDKTTIVVGRENVGTGNELQGFCAGAGNTMNIVTYNNLYPGGTGYVIYMSGFLSVA